jgi:cytochrome c5
MSLKIALRLAVLAFGAAFASAPALAQQYTRQPPNPQALAQTGTCDTVQVLRRRACHRARHRMARQADCIIRHPAWLPRAAAGL